MYLVGKIGKVLVQLKSKVPKGSSHGSLHPFLKCRIYLASNKRFVLIHNSIVPSMTVNTKFIRHLQPSFYVLFSFQLLKVNTYLIQFNSRLDSMVLEATGQPTTVLQLLHNWSIFQRMKLKIVDDWI